VIEGVGPKSERPLLNPAVNLAEVRLSPPEAFVLSRVDGQTSYEDICAMTGLDNDATVRILQKLRRDRLLLHPGEKAEPLPAAVSRASAGAARAAADRNKRGSRVGGAPVPMSLLETLDDRSPVDPAELEPGPDLDLETKTRIIRLHRRCKSLKAHELLGVAPGADTSLVKRAYFSASKELHPDRFYGKNIGPFRDRLSDIFSQLTRAFEQLKK
jgi:DnaJ-domain-containing protein 1